MKADKNLINPRRDFNLTLSEVTGFDPRETAFLFALRSILGESHIAVLLRVPGR
jgi:hypothetical protein